MSSAVIKLTQKREGGKKIVEVTLPRRMLTALRSINPEALRFSFGVNEQFEISARELQEAVASTYKRRRQAEAEAERVAKMQQRKDAANAQLQRAAEEARAKKEAKAKAAEEARAKREDI